MGPLAGLTIIEIKGLGPGPYAGMLFADLGAEVIVVERSFATNSIAVPAASDPNSRGKQSIALNLKTPSGLETLLTIVEQADALFEGYRPGVAERLGFGPEICLKRNPKLVYGRITGWGQYGPLAQAAGHDINYIALTGALAAIGGPDKPVPPLNLVGDFAGGSLFLVMGMLAALLHAQKTGEGQVVDTAITDGSASLMSMLHGLAHQDRWQEQRASNWLDGAAHFYDTYETSDAKFVAIGSIEPKFYALLLEKAGLDPKIFAPQMDQTQWPQLKQQLATVIKTKTRDQWCELLEATDVCFAPVLDYTEAPQHPHNVARETYIELGGVVQPGIAPKFSVSEPEIPTAPGAEGGDTDTVLTRFGFSTEAIAKLRHNGGIPAV